MLQLLANHDAFYVGETTHRLPRLTTLHAPTWAAFNNSFGRIQLTLPALNGDGAYFSWRSHIATIKSMPATDAEATAEDRPAIMLRIGRNTERNRQIHGRTLRRQPERSH